MLKSQELAIEIKKLTQEMNKMPLELRADDPKYEVRMAERHTMQAKLLELQKRQGEALESESARAEGAEYTAETSEVRELVHRANAGAIIAAVAEHRATDGPEHELQRALGVAGDVVPWQLMEHRAAATFTPNTGEATVGRFVGKAFADSIAALVGCQVVQVPSGEADYPILSTGATVGYQTDSTAIAESDGVFTVEKLTPRNRYQASFAVLAIQGILIGFDQIRLKPSHGFGLEPFRGRDEGRPIRVRHKEVGPFNELPLGGEIVQMGSRLWTEGSVVGRNNYVGLMGGLDIPGDRILDGETETLQTNNGRHARGYGESCKQGAPPLPLQRAKGVLDVEEKATAYDIPFDSDLA